MFRQYETRNTYKPNKKYGKGFFDPYGVEGSDTN